MVSKWSWDHFSLDDTHVCGIPVASSIIPPTAVAATAARPVVAGLHAAEWAFLGARPSSAAATGTNMSTCSSVFNRKDEKNVLKRRDDMMVPENIREKETAMKEKKKQKNLPWQ